MCVLMTVVNSEFYDDVCNILTKEQVMSTRWNVMVRNSNMISYALIPIDQNLMNFISNIKENIA